MGIVDHAKECLRFWKPTVARKITLYFAVFGLVIFYLTSVAYLVVAKNYLVDSITRVVQMQISEMPGTENADVWWSFTDRRNPHLRSLARTVTSFASGTHTVNRVAIYGRSPVNETWYRMTLDENDVLRSEPLEPASIQKLELDDEAYAVRSDSDLYVGPRKIGLFVNITASADEGTYFYKVVIDRQGVTCLFGNGTINFIAISLAALLLFRMIGYLFARRLAAPIETLSDAAAKVAKGDLSFRIPAMGPTEIGDLARNFNQMIVGLQEWQRIKQIEAEMEKGRRIQRDFLPGEIPEIPNWEIATCFFPAKLVSGDFYDVFELPGGRIGLVIADVADKGVGSALYMALIRSLVRVYAEQTLSANSEEMIPETGASRPALREAGGRELQVIRLTNSYLARHHGHEGMFATLFFGVLDPVSGNLIYVNGGHEPLYVLGKNGVKQELRPTGPAVGLMEELSFNAQRVQLEPGDLLFGLTDGVTEACNPQEEFFTRNRVKEMLAQPMASSKELLERIRRQVFDFVDTAPRADDITMLAVQRMV